MPEPKNDSRRAYAYANAPVNRRTAARTALKETHDLPEPLPEAVRLRVQKNRQRQLLGVPLSELLKPHTGSAPTPSLRSLPQQPRLHPGRIAAMILGVAAASAFILWRSHGGWAWGSGLSLLGGACWWWQRKSQRAMQQAEGTNWLASAQSSFFLDLDDDTLHRIDHAFRSTAVVVDEPTLAALISLKTAVGRIALSLNHAEINSEFTQEDRLYVMEAVRRYIPDTLNAYLQVPLSQRATPSAQAGLCADHILLNQLALLQSELEQREQRLHAGSIEALLREQRFLQAKAAGG